MDTQNNLLTESLASEVKQEIISYLIDEGYGTYARRLSEYKFIISDDTEIAHMDPNSGSIVINPDMVNISKMSVADDVRTDYDKMMDQLSVLIRHELLHFMLVHTKRFEEHLIKKDPKWQKIFNAVTAEDWTDITHEDAAEFSISHDVANQAMDFEISLEGYDDHDKAVVRLMTLNNRVVGGLIAEDDHPEWGKKTMEEMYDILMTDVQKEIDKIKNTPPTVINVEEETHSQEYINMYNKIISIFNDDNYSDRDLNDILASASSNKEILDNAGNIVVAEGEY